MGPCSAQERTLGIQLALHCCVLLHMDLPCRGTRCPQLHLESVGDKGTWAVGGLRRVPRAARDLCLNSRGQSLAQGY